MNSQMYPNRDIKLLLKKNPEVRGTKAMTHGRSKSTDKHEESYSINALP